LVEVLELRVCLAIQNPDIRTGLAWLTAAEIRQYRDYRQICGLAAWATWRPHTRLEAKLQRLFTQIRRN
jgi:hypothetical protein